MPGRDPIATLLLACGTLAMALVSSIALHPANPFTVAVVVVALGLAVLAARGEARPGATFDGPRSSLWAYAGLAVMVACPPLQSPVASEPEALRSLLYASSALSLLLLIVHAGSATARTRNIALGLLLASRLVVLLLLPLLVPRPEIDVWNLQQQATTHLLHGHNPYTTPIDDIYRGRSAFGHQALYAYPPLNLVASVPSVALLGDYRYGLVLSLGGALLLLRAAGRRAGTPAAILDVATLALALHPQLERLVIHGWTEPYLVLVACAFAFLQARDPRGLAAMAALLCLPLLKQYTAVPVLLYVAMIRPRPRALLGAAGLLALPAALLLAWTGPALVRTGLLFFVQHLQFREDAISLPAALHRLGLLRGWHPGVPVTLGVQLVVASAAGWALRGRGAGGFVLAAALSLLAGFLFAPQAFLNYYAFVGALLVVAVVLLAADRANRAPLSSRPSWRWAVAVPLGVAALVAATSISVRVIDFLVDCSHGAERARARIGRGEAVLEDGAIKAGSDDTIALCEARHCLGPLCHADLLCVCARSGTTTEEVGQWLLEQTHAPATCRLDEPHPTPEDDGGACRRARCDVHAEIP